MSDAIAPADRAVALKAALSEVTAERKSSGGLTAIRHFPAVAETAVEFPPELHRNLREALLRRGIERLYSHQRQAYERARGGDNVIVVTPTASGKTLCYNLPVLDTVLAEPHARALYLFPTKALSQDQLAELGFLTDAMGSELCCSTYDGDTPREGRKAIRSQAQIVLSNPDMLHTGILPHHPKWVKLFENLRYVVIDEIHAYRGVFGSHLANILRRLRRIARFYGARPVFICCSATIANPKQLGERLIGEPLHLIDQSGAPRGEKYFLFYNPPVINAQLGIRRSCIHESRRIALSFLTRGLQTIVFTPSRLQTELLVTYLKRTLEEKTHRTDLVRGYRGGYLPSKRREIEKGLREATVLGVVSTNALELGIDIGNLDVAILAGYPGSIASTWQQSGRAGRRQAASVAILVASASPLNQFIVSHPDYFFRGSPEHGLIDPDNLSILVDHIKCAAFELPFTAGETFGEEDLLEILGFLEEHGLVHSAGDHWHWTAEAYPAESVSLRSISSDNFVVVDETTKARAIAEVDYASAFSTLHEKAIYIVEGQQYLVEHFDHKARRASVRQCETDYFTEAITTTGVNILDCFASQPAGRAVRSHGEVHVVSRVVGFKKIKLYTMENLGSAQLDMPEQEMHSTAYWLTIPREVLAAVEASPEDRRDGVVGLANALKSLAMLFLMCDRADIGVALGDNAQRTATVERSFRPSGKGQDRGGAPLAFSRGYEPNIFIYDNHPGGIGFSEPLYKLHSTLLRETRSLIESCPCWEGCPSCVGPSGEVGTKGKPTALAILEAIGLE